MNSEEKLTHQDSSQLADSPRKTPAPANRDLITQMAVNRRVASSNLARGAKSLRTLFSTTSVDTLLFVSNSKRQREPTLQAIKENFDLFQMPS